MSSDIIRVILADDHVVVRSGLRTILQAAPDISVISEAADGAQAIELAERYTPDVVVMDLTMNGLDGLTATKEITTRRPEVRVLVLTMHGEEEYLVAALEAGAQGYLVKNAAERELVDAVRSLAHGDMYVQPRAARVLSQRLRRTEDVPDDQARLAQLTDRERDVLRLVAQGFSAPEIGEKLFISPKTVDTYKQRVQEKLGLSHRADFVQFALKLGLLQRDETE